MSDFITRCRSALRAFREEPAAPPPVPVLAVATPPRLRDPSPFDVGLRDRVMAGWFQNATAELLGGVPVVRGQLVVDVGCGDGGNAGFCAQHGARVILVDKDAERLKGAMASVRARGGLEPESLVTDCAPIPLPEGCADIVICTEVLEHVDDPVALMGELFRIGRPGAVYVLTVPDPECERLISVTAPDEYFKAPNHIRIIERDDFAALVQGAGLQIDRRQGLDAYWAFLWVVNYMGGGWIHPPWAPVVEHWARTWTALLDHPRGREVKRAFDDAWPRTQLIVAHKPGGACE
jgi:SAM-dependent methyltransferase